MTAPISTAALDVLVGAHRTYTPATLGAVTAIHPDARSGGLSFVTQAGEQKLLLSAADLQVLWSELGDALVVYHRTNSQSLRSSDGSISEVFSPDEVLK